MGTLPLTVFPRPDRLGLHTVACCAQYCCFCARLGSFYSSVVAVIGRSVQWPRPRGEDHHDLVGASGGVVRRGGRYIMTMLVLPI